MKTKPSLFPLALSVLLILGSSQKAIAKNDQQAKPINRQRGLFGGADTINRSSAFTCYPTNFVASTLKVGYEFSVAQNKGLKIIGSYGSSQGSNDFYLLDQFNEFGLEAQFRFYVLKNRPSLSGLYLAPFASYKSMTYSGSTNYDGLVQYNGPGPTYVTNATVSDFCAGYVIGYQFIYSSGFTLDFFAGGGDNFISGNNSGGSLATSLFEYRSGIDFHAGIGIGVSF